MQSVLGVVESPGIFLMLESGSPDSDFVCNLEIILLKTAGVCVCVLDPREPVPTDPERPHLQGDECTGSLSYAVHSVSCRVGLARSAQH